MLTREDVLTERVKAIDFDRIETVAELMEAYKDSSIQSRALATCAMAIENAMKDGTRPTVILGLSGALIAGGLRKVIADMIRNFSRADIAIINLLSVRKPLSGIIRGEYVEWALPFANKLVTMDLTGEQIEQPVTDHLLTGGLVVLPRRVIAVEVEQVDERPRLVANPL